MALPPDEEAVSEAPAMEEVEPEKDDKQQSSIRQKKGKVSFEQKSEASFKGSLDEKGRTQASPEQQQAAQESFAQQRVPSEPDFKAAAGFNEDSQVGFPDEIKPIINFSSEFEETQSRFYSIPPEFLRLITARSLLRIFPLAVDEVLAHASTLKHADASFDVLRLWRLALMLWAESIDDKPIESVAKSMDGVAAFYSPSESSQSFASAATLLFVEYPEKQPGQFIDTCRSSIQAIAAHSLTDEQDIWMAIGMINEDILWLEKHAENATELRRKPLWHDEKVEQDNWRLALLNKQDDFSETDLSVIFQAYQAMLTGSWDGELTPQTILKGTAELRPQDDAPADNDSLGREALVKALAPRLSDNGDHSHLTIGLLGNWGIGKTSVLRQLVAELNKDIHNQYLFGEFNAWSYEHTGNVQAGLAHEVISALTTANPRWLQLQRWFHKPYVIWKYTTRKHGMKIVGIAAFLFIAQTSGVLGWLATFIKGIGPAAAGAGSLVVAWFALNEIKKMLSQPLAKELKTYLRLPDAKQYLGTIPEMKKNIKDLCDICLGKGWWGQNRRLIFFIDDLDRCDVDGIVKTFEAIRLVLDRDWVTVVIAMDQRIALPALACNYKKLSEFHDHRDPMSIARDYLGKVIHLPIRLGDPDDLSVAQYLAKIWDDDEFLLKIKSELETTTSELSSNNPQQTPGDIPNGQSSDEVDAAEREPIEKILQDIQSIDVESVFTGNQSPAVEESEIDGFGPNQKEVFYRWLINFNLRNPRQIKRLYNSFNLLWSIYDSTWKTQQEDAWRPNMLGLLVLEKINEQLPFETDKDFREPLRRLIFKDTRWKKVTPAALAEEEFIKLARKEIQHYQKQFDIDLLKRLKPFVLPGVRPEQSGAGN
jgi:hypothetical protein